MGVEQGRRLVKRLNADRESRNVEQLSLIVKLGEETLDCLVHDILGGWLSWRWKCGAKRRAVVLYCSLIELG